MHTISETIHTIDDLDIIIEDNNIKDNPQLLIQFFCGIADLGIIQKYQYYFKDTFPKATLIGSTSDGVIEDDTVHVIDTSVVVFSLFEHTTLNSLIIDHDDSFYDYYQSGYMIASNLVTKNTKVLITFTDAIHTNGEEYVKGISSFNKNTVIAGGMAGDNGALKQTYIFDKEYISSDGAIAVALDSTVLQVTTSYSFDWMPIGKSLSVTKSIGNRVYEIDGYSALELYAKYLGRELANSLPQIGIEFPLIVDRDGINTARAVLFKHDDGSLTFAGNILEGELVHFGIGNVETILRGGHQNLRSIVEKSEKKIESYFIYSCMARRRFMGVHIEKELQAFSKSAPTTGFFTYGEFFHTNQENQLLNETMTVLALSESETPIDENISNSLVGENYYVINPIHTMANLTNVISRELEDLNKSLESRVNHSTDLIYKQAYYDKLTSLPNRLKLINELPQHVNKILLLLNVDNFTLVNDFYGHDTGDALLKKIGKILEEFCSKENAMIFKLPSDEFALILHKKFTKVELEGSIKNLLQIMKEMYVEYESYKIRVDVTVSASTISNESFGMSNANMALKHAKSKGLDFLIFDDSFNIAQNYETNLNIATQIRRAIDSDDIIPYFQPIFSVDTNKIEKYECLVRLRQENAEVLSPGLFLEIAQKMKLYPYITKIMIEKTFSFFQKNSLDFTINLSLEDIQRDETRNFIFEKIQEYGIASQLIIEILETQEISNQDIVEAFIKRVYECGAKIAIDDFGSGFANFHHITTIRADYLKIDGSLIKNIKTDENARLVVETIIIFAQKLNMRTVAEFVHSKEVYDEVCSLGVDLVQGYYLDMPSEHIKEF